MIKRNGSFYNDRLRSKEFKEEIKMRIFSDQQKVYLNVTESLIN